jgi:surface protein
MKSLFRSFWLLLLLLSVHKAQSSPFITTWKTDNPGTSANHEILIPGVGNYTVHWMEVGVPANHGSISGSGSLAISFPFSGTYEVRISGGMTRIVFHDGGDKLKLLTIEQWGSLGWTSMRNAFYGCANLSCHAVDTPNLAAVTDMSNAFYNCSLFNGDLSGWDVSGVSNMNNLFRGAAAFNQNLRAWDVSQVSGMAYLFSGASSFDQNLGEWDLSSVTNLSNMLDNSGLSRLKYDSTLIGWGTRGVPPGLGLGALGLHYCEGETQRDSLIAIAGWCFTGDTKTCTTFPVEWLHFSAQAEGKHVLLSWTTASEQNSDFFAVERSADRKQWEELGTQAAAGSSRDQLNYQFEDQRPPSNTAWYRLRQVDLDGSFQYSSTVAIQLAEAGIEFYPNPVKDRLNVEVPSGQWLRVELINQQGQQVWQQELSGGRQQLSLSDLPSGLYTLQMRNEQNRATSYQLVKQ